MTVAAWLTGFGTPVCGSALGNPQAAALMAFVERYAATVATFVEARRRGEEELVVLDIRTGAPQSPVYPIRRSERVGILFVGEAAIPFVVMLRDDFPDTEHQQVVPEGHPAVICIDDRPWAEALLTWTPAELIERILMWFRARYTWRTARCTSTARSGFPGYHAELHHRAVHPDYKHRGRLDRRT